MNNKYFIMLNFTKSTIIFKYEMIYIKDIRIPIPNMLDFQFCMKTKKARTLLSGLLIL